MVVASYQLRSLWGALTVVWQSLADRSCCRAPGFRLRARLPVSGHRRAERSGSAGAARYFPRNQEAS